MARLLAPWWNGRRAWFCWPAWTTRMPPGRIGALRSSSGLCLPHCGKRCPMIGAKRWRTMSGWHTTSRSRSSLPIPTAPGNAGPTRIRMACYASTCQRAPTYTQRELNAIAHRLNTRPQKCSPLPRRWRSMRNCAIFHLLHLELGTALSVISKWNQTFNSE